MQQPRLAGEPKGDPPEILPGVSRILPELDAQIQHALVSFWDEASRARASSLAASLSELCRDAGLEEACSLLRKLRSLLSLPYGDASAIRIPLTEQCEELVLLLKQELAAGTRVLPGARPPVPGNGQERARDSMGEAFPDLGHRSDNAEGHRPARPPEPRQYASSDHHG